MPDITMCLGKDDKGLDCVKRMECYRHTAQPNPSWQSWFVASPWFNGQCEMFWSNEEYGQIHRTRFGDNNQKSDQQQGTPDVAGQSSSEGGSAAC